jgi:hypothetical protein
MQTNTDEAGLIDWDVAALDAICVVRPANGVHESVELAYASDTRRVNATRLPLEHSNF